MRRFILALVALVGLSGAVSFAANYAMTQGSGTTFGSVVVGGVNYVQMMICDLTTPGQCATVSAGGAVKVDGSAVTQPVSIAAATPAGTNIIGKVGIDQTTPGTTNGVAIVGINGATALAGAGATGTGSPRVTIASDSPGAGFNTAVAFTPTVQNAAYSSGNAIGGLQTLSFFRSTAQPSGVFDNFSITSKGGSTTGITAYLFNANPSGSTCTDKVAFSLAAADVSKLAMQPFVLTPAVIGTGTTATTAQYGQTISIKNLDGGSVSFYVCLVVNGTVTPASTTDLVAVVSGALD